MYSKKKKALFSGGNGEKEEEGGSSSSCKKEDSDLMDSMSKDGSQYSLSVSVLPSLGPNRTNRKVKLRRFIISPFDRS